MPLAGIKCGGIVVMNQMLGSGFSLLIKLVPPRWKPMLHMPDGTG